MPRRVTLIRGDGIGPEVVDAAVRVVEATGVALDWDVQTVGAAAFAQEGTPLPQRVIDSIATNGVALKGPVATPSGRGFRSLNIALRAALGLHVCIRPSRSYLGAPAPLGAADVVVIRMTADDLYAGIEFDAGSPAAEDLAAVINRKLGTVVAEDSGFSIKPISRAASARAAAAAFDYARAQGRRKVTIVHKATVMRSTDGLFVEAAREMASAYPEIECEERQVDSVCHTLVTRPGSLDVLFTSMLYGDILSDLCAALVGGLGLAPGASVGAGCAVFDVVHGTAPRLAGRNIANPMAAILSGGMLLRHLGEDEASRRLEAAVATVIREGRTLTYDLRRDRAESAAGSTSEVADAVVAALV